MPDADAPRHTIDSPIRIGKIHPKARKQFNGLSRAHQQLLMQKVNRELAPTEYKMYRGSHVRKHRLYHTHITDNIVFNFLLEDGEGIVIFIGKHKDTDHAADQFHKQSLDLSSSLSLEESGLILPSTPESEEEPMPNPTPIYHDEGQTHPDLVDVAGLLDSSIRSLVSELLEASVQAKVDSLELRVDQQELDHEALGTTLIQEQRARDDLTTALQQLRNDWAKYQETIQEHHRTGSATHEKLQRLYEVTSRGLARQAATVTRLSIAFKRSAGRIHDLDERMVVWFSELMQSIHATLNERLADVSKQFNETIDERTVGIETRFKATTATLSSNVLEASHHQQQLAESQQRLTEQAEQQGQELSQQIAGLQTALQQSKEHIRTLNIQIEGQSEHFVELKQAQSETVQRLQNLREEFEALKQQPPWWKRWAKR